MLSWALALASAALLILDPFVAFLGGNIDSCKDQDIRRCPFPGELQHVQRLAVIGLGADTSVQPRHGLHVVIEDMWASVEHSGHGVKIAAEIRRQHLDPRSR